MIDTMGGGTSCEAVQATGVTAPRATDARPSWIASHPEEKDKGRGKVCPVPQPIALSSEDIIEIRTRCIYLKIWKL